MTTEWHDDFHTEEKDGAPECIPHGGHAPFGRCNACESPLILTDGGRNQRCPKDHSFAEIFGRRVALGGAE